MKQFIFLMAIAFCLSLNACNSVSDGEAGGQSHPTESEQASPEKDPVPEKSVVPEGQGEETTSATDPPTEEVTDQVTDEVTDEVTDRENTTSNTTTEESIVAPMFTLKGTFVEVQEGDYLHFMVKDEKGELRSFWLSDDIPEAEWMPFLTQAHPPGTKVEVKWKTVVKNIPESGGDMELEEAQEIYILE